MVAGVGACEDTVISAATFVSVEPFSEEFSSMHAVVYVCSDDSTHVIDDEVSDVETEFCYTTDQHSFDTLFVDNPMFDMDATLSYDNPLFEIDVDHPLEWSWTHFSPSVDMVQFSIATVGDVLVATNFDEDVVTGTIDMSAYGSSVATSFSGIVGDDQDSNPIYIMWVNTGKKRMRRSSMELPSGDILTSTSSAQILGAMLQDMWLVLMMLVYSWFSVDKDVTHFFIWDPGGAWSSLCCRIA